MPDFTMCQNHECIMKANCFRYSASPSMGAQSYAVFTPQISGLGRKEFKCTNFKEILKKTKYPIEIDLPGTGPPKEPVDYVKLIKAMLSAQKYRLDEVRAKTIRLEAEEEFIEKNMILLKNILENK